MDQVVAGSTVRDRLNTILLAIFALIAILLASIGLYGVIAYSIEQRTQEFGIRLALGANPSHLRNLIVRQTMGFAVAGILIGIAASLGLTPLMASMLYGVKATDPVVFTAVAVSMSLVAVFASLLPARRSRRIDPVIALRHE
jgi:ABC-type antimicrobial peptide transport system permease subunit